MCWKNITCIESCGQTQTTWWCLDIGIDESGKRQDERNGKTKQIRLISMFNSLRLRNIFVQYTSIWSHRMEINDENFVSHSRRCHLLSLLNGVMLQNTKSLFYWRSINYYGSVLINIPPCIIFTADDIAVISFLQLVASVIHNLRENTVYP